MERTDSGRPARHIAIIGSGFSGLCLAIQLKRAGIHSFTLFEKADRLGGTWRENTYPGAACDVPSISYCFSFEQRTDWSQLWAPQEEILEYLEHCARKYAVLPHIRFETEIASAHFDAAAAQWQLETAAGETIRADVLVSGVGQLSRPQIPDIPGLDDFAGECFHSAQWNHAYDLTHKRVGVIGNAASAIQFIPQIAPQVKRLEIFQRSANWMIPRGNRSYTDAEKRRFARFPWLARLQRFLAWSLLEARFPTFRGNAMFAERTQQLALDAIKESVADPALRATLTPDYPIGGKRILISDDYYASLNRANVDLVLSHIERIEADAVVTRDAARHELDALILATGFASTQFLAPMEIVGLEGRRLEDDWQNGAEAYLGMTVAGYPNFFISYGPNTNLGHNSIIFMIECQTNYIVSCIGELFRRKLRWLDVRRDVMNAYNLRLQQQLDRTVWAATDHSWYKNAAGKITNNWSGTTLGYWWKTRRPDLRKFKLEAPASNAAARVPAPSGAEFDREQPA